MSDIHTSLECKVRISFSIWESQNTRLRAAQIHQDEMQTKVEEAYAEYYEFQAEMAPPHIMESAQARINNFATKLEAAQWEVSSATAALTSAQVHYEKDYRAWEVVNQ
ncbi:hypothetical protein L486_05559 [Kwoniella mangroviensis CBS 10435]|uniref:Uncharacterized protein n=1 Tax=Kwoniella mangroviensis CBS 10435 TaxID=1331196 RepID=A0A1B9IM95_9TREE|nr:hypothetical protein L486_05559 [Kwoniella mangroviensis CBS 10435]